MQKVSSLTEYRTFREETCIKNPCSAYVLVKLAFKMFKFKFIYCFLHVSKIDVSNRTLDNMHHMHVSMCELVSLMK